MKKINVALVRLVQFVVFVVFTFTVISYFGAIILLPLSLLSLLIMPFKLLGLGFIGAVCAIPVIGYLCMMAYKTPNLAKMVVDTGVDLMKVGKTRVEAFNEIISVVNG